MVSLLYFITGNINLPLNVSIFQIYTVTQKLALILFGKKTTKNYYSLHLRG